MFSIDLQCDSHFGLGKISACWATVRHWFDMIKYEMIQNKALQWLKLNINLIANSQKTPHTSLVGANYGASLASILQNNALTCRFKIVYFLMGPWDPHAIILTNARVLGMGPIIDVFYQLKILRCIPRTQLFSSWWVHFEFLPEASFGLWVLSSPASVCLSVCLCVYQSLACPHDNSSAVHARITKFGWETQNTLVKMPIIFGVIDLDLQGQI